MTSYKYIIKSFLFALVVLLVAACGGDEQVQQENPAPVAKKKVIVKTKKLVGKPFNSFISAIGTVKPIKHAQLASQQGGEIKMFNKDKGSGISKNEVIVELDNDILKANLDAAEAQYLLAKVTFEKQEKIFKDNVNSEYEFLQAKYSYKQAKANYDMLKATYDDTFIKAPFNGIVDKKYYEEGEMAAPTAPIVEVINTSKLKVEAGIPERYSGAVKKGNMVQVIFGKETGDTLTTKITYVGASVDSENRTFPIELEIPASKRVKPEMVAELKVYHKTYENVIVIPDEVIERGDNSYVVFIAKNGKAVSSNINIVARFGKSVAVNEGLTSGDELITVGYENLVHDQEITIE